MQQGIYDPPPSLWEYVKSKVPCAEHDEMQRILGFASINENEVLHDEARALLSIWRDLRTASDNTDSPATEKNTPGTASLNLLREPPLIRELVTNEVRFLGENLAMLLHNGTSTDTILKMGGEILSKGDREVLAHALHTTTQPLAAKNVRQLGKVVVHAGGGATGVTTTTAWSRGEVRHWGAPHELAGSAVIPVIPDIDRSRGSTSSCSGYKRPQSAKSKDGKETPLLPVDPERRHLDKEMSSVIDRLSVFNVDNVVERIQGALKEEQKILLQDVDFLHECIIEEHDYNTQQLESVTRSAKEEGPANATRSFPSIRKLQGVAAVLQKIYNERFSASSRGRQLHRRSDMASSSSQRLPFHVTTRMKNVPRLQSLSS